MLIKVIMVLVLKDSLKTNFMYLLLVLKPRVLLVFPPPGSVKFVEDFVSTIANPPDHFALVTEVVQV